MSKYRMLKCSICDGFGLVKRTDKDICNYCGGRGYIVFKRKYEDINNYQSFLEH